MINLRIIPGTYEVLKEHAKAKGVSPAAFIARVLDALARGEQVTLPSIELTHLTHEGTHNAEESNAQGRAPA